MVLPGKNKADVSHHRINICDYMRQVKAMLNEGTQSIR